MCIRDRVIPPAIAARQSYPVECHTLEHIPVSYTHLDVYKRQALERPGLVGRVVADSFDGRTLADDFSKNLIQERTGAKTDNMAVEFYQWCQGEDWERIVDLDTKALLQCAGEKLPLFSKPLHSLQVPLLLMGSEGDEMSRADFQDEYRAIAGETGAEICIFAEGRHPAILSNAEEAAERISKFLE